MLQMPWHKPACLTIPPPSRPDHPPSLLPGVPCPLQICDIKAICEVAHAAGALVCVDNSFMAPLWQVSEWVAREGCASG